MSFSADSPHLMVFSMPASTICLSSYDLLKLFFVSFIDVAPLLFFLKVEVKAGSIIYGDVSDPIGYMNRNSITCNIR